jgi:hypothetical protein
MAGICIAERIGQVLELSDALMKRQLPEVLVTRTPNYATRG